MRAVVITGHGDPSVLRVEERPDPVPGPGQVVIDVKAAGLNFADVMARMGLYPDAPKPPVVVGYEVAGVVEGTGERVLAPTRFGGQAERVVVRASDTMPLPDTLSYAQGAAIPVNYATAWAALMTYGNLQPGERVLIHAAAGGVGMAATQIAKRHGAHVLGTASPGKHEAIRANGVDEAFGYDLPRTLPKVDIVLDAIGGASFRRSYDLLRAGGRLVAFGASSVVGGEKRNLVRAAPQALRMFRGFNLLEQMSASKAVIGLNLLTLWDDRQSLESFVAPLREMLEDGSLRPVVSDEVPFDRAADAHRIITERRNVGKVVLVP
ncbi:MAG TPA: zinc-binding dehydrogenase [Solirubrobacteraceae bacterium]|jgi:NADPH:quinone reductase-like Zn-dependent oxidoreductase